MMARAAAPKDRTLAEAGKAVGDEEAVERKAVRRIRARARTMATTKGNARRAQATVRRLSPSETPMTSKRQGGDGKEDLRPGET